MRLAPRIRAKSTERSRDLLEILTGSLYSVQRALHPGQYRQPHPLGRQGAGENYLITGDSFWDRVGISHEARQSLRGGGTAMLGEPAPHALDIDHMPLHPAPMPMSLDQMRLLQGFEQAMGGHLAARASFGELPDRPGFLGVVGDQLCGPQAACA